MATTTQDPHGAVAQNMSVESFTATEREPRIEAPKSHLDRVRHIAGHATLALAQGIDVELLTIEKPDSVVVDRDGARFIDKATMHNTRLPHSAFRGQTPDEMYFKTGNDIPAELEAAKISARQSRMENNRSMSCRTCELLTSIAGLLGLRSVKSPTKTSRRPAGC